MVDDPKNHGFGPAPLTVAGDPARDATVLSARPVELRADLRRPVQLGRYRLLDRLGVGGMAEVYLAEQVGVAGFQKRVVVKRILPHLAADKQFVEMFAREAKIAARVSHPNVVQIFELGEENGELFIAMEHIDGLTLYRLAAAAWQEGRAVPVDVVVRTIADAALGLHAAHTLCDDAGRPYNLVHRDVSPDNLMVSKDGVTKVLDFGIAKGDLGGPKTKTGNLRGKIPFMPPEQIRGEILDGRADLYALGVSAYWMLTGERPFDRPSDWHTMQAILTEEPKPPSSLNGAVPRGLDALVLRMIDKERERRPATGRAVAEELEDLASPSSVGGKKTTVAFLAEVLPAAKQRGNPVSEVRPQVPALPSNDAAPAAPSPRPAPAPAAPPDAAEPPHPAPASVASPAPSPAPSLPSAVAAATVAAADDEERARVKPVTTPAAPNAIADVLVPARPSTPSLPLRFGALVLAAGAVVGGSLVVWTVVGPSRPSSADAGVRAADAGVVAVVDAGLPAPAPLTRTVKALRAPARVRWSVGGVVLGVGEGTLTVPAETKSLLAEDLRRRFQVEVPIVDGVADYGAVPQGTVILVRVGDKTVVKLGDDDVSRQRKLVLAAGLYRFRVARGGVVKDVPVELKAGQTFTLDASR